MEITTIVTIEMTQITTMDKEKIESTNLQRVKERYIEMIKEVMDKEFASIDDLNVKVQMFIGEETHDET